MSTHAGGRGGRSRGSRSTRSQNPAARASRHAQTDQRAENAMSRMPPPGTMQERPLSRVEQQDYKELKAKAATYARQADVFERRSYDLAHQGDRAGARFYRTMARAARSQLQMLRQYEEKRARLRAYNKAMRAQRDAEKVQQMRAGRATKPSARPGSAVAWARANPDEVGRHGDSDPALERIAAEQGFTGRPWSASRAQVDTLVRDYGAHEFYRGFSSRTRGGTEEEATARARGYAHAFTQGPYRAGQGTYGSGYYVMAQDGAREAVHDFGLQYGGVIMRGAVAPSARMIDLSEAKQQMQTEGNAYLRAHGVTPQFPVSDYFGTRGGENGDPAAAQLGSADRGEYQLRFGDVGRWAALQGYDALGGPQSRYWIILNRGVAIAQRGLQRPSARVAFGEDDYREYQREQRAARRAAKKAGG